MRAFMILGGTRMPALKASSLGEERAERPSYRTTSSSQQSLRRRERAAQSDGPSQQSPAYQGSINNSGPMQPAVWVDSSVGRADTMSSRSQAASRSPMNRGSLDSSSIPSDYERANMLGKGLSRAAAIREGPQNGRPTDRLGSHTGATKGNSAITRDAEEQPFSQSPQLRQDWAQMNPGRGSQSGVHEEQPATSGRVDATSSRGDAQAGGPLRDIFRGRKLQFWSRNTSRDSSQDGSKSTSGSPQPNSSRQQIKPNWVKGQEDDWAANEVQLRDEEDGWGGSFVNKKTRQQPQRAQSQVSEAETAQMGSTNGAGVSQAAGQNYRTQRSADESTSKSSVEETPERPDLAGQDGAERVEPEGLSRAEEVLEAEVLGVDADWEASEEDWEEGVLPDITPLAPDEADELLPIIPTPDQMGQNWGGAVEFGQRAAAALALTIVVAKFNLVLLATGSATFVFWGPVLGAINRNRILRNSGRYVGLWRASVVAAQVELPDRRSYTSRPGYASQRGSPTLRLLVGDDSGARSLLILPYNKRYDAIQIGEAAEVLVLSPQSSFNSFKALKEIYLPESGLWLSDYPHVNRNLFLEISLEIERERKITMAEGAFEVSV